MPDQHVRAMRRLVPGLRVKPGSKVRLPRDFDPAHTARYAGRAEAEAELKSGVELLTDMQAKLAAQQTFALLVVLQGMDASGKDGLVKHVLSGLNPQGVTVHSFKVPSTEELSHDYLWRYARALPARGMIGIFNRSHYEEVLVVRVHRELLERQRLPQRSRAGVWQRRYAEINAWEHYLVDNGVHVLKIFLNVSRAEQRRRFLDRLDNPDKTWKFSVDDVRERRYWDQYQRAYEQVLSNTSTPWAPWHVVPADHKWFTRLAAAGLVIDALEALRPQYPRVTSVPREELDQARAELEAEREG